MNMKCGLFFTDGAVSWFDFSTVLCGLMISNLGKLFLVKEKCVPIFHFVTVLKKYEKNQ